METAIELNGAAAADAQTLVAELQENGIALRPVDRDDSDREIARLAVEFGVAFLAEASFSVVRDLVRGWLRRRGHEDSDAQINPVDPEPDEQGPTSAPS